MPHAESTKNAAVYNNVTVRATDATFGWIAMPPRQNVRPTPPANPEQLWVYAHAHGIKLLSRKYFL